MALPPAVSRVRSAVREDLRALAGPAGLVLVACSGGPDSLALAAAAAVEGPRLGVRVGAVVVDHAWTPDSAAVADRASTACRGLGLDPVVVVPVAVVPGGEGPEGDARAGRYAALEAERSRLGAVAVLLGHTLDDQAETVLLGLARGSGARSLAGMAAVRGVWRRPLLGERRATTVAACADLRLDPWLDPANDDPAYTRSRLRAAVPVLEDTLGPGLTEALARTAAQLREDADTLDTLAATLLAAARLPAPQLPASQNPRDQGSLPGAAVDNSRHPQESPANFLDHGGLELDVGVLAGVGAAVRKRALLAAAKAAGAPGGSLTHRHVEAMDRLVTAWHGQGPADLPGGIRASRAYGRLRLEPRGSEGLT